MWPVRRLITAEWPQQLCRSKFIQHLPGLRFIHRGDAEDHVIERLRENTAQPEHDNRTELRIVKKSGDEFTTPGEHGLDQQPFQILTRHSHNLPGGFPDIGPVFQIQLDQAALRLVGQLCPQPFQHHGESGCLGLSSRILFRLDHPLFHHGNSIVLQYLLGFRLRQGCSSHRLCFFNQIKWFHINKVSSFLKICADIITGSPEAQTGEALQRMAP